MGRSGNLLLLPILHVYLMSCAGGNSLPSARRNPYRRCYLSVRFTCARRPCLLSRAGACASGCPIYGPKPMARTQYRVSPYLISSTPLSWPSLGTLDLAPRSQINSSNFSVWVSTLVILGIHPFQSGYLPLRKISLTNKFYTIRHPCFCLFLKFSFLLLAPCVLAGCF